MEENNIFRSISGILLGNVELAQDFQVVIKEENAEKIMCYTIRAKFATSFLF